MRPIHGVVVAVAVGGAAAFGASAIRDTTHLGAAAQAAEPKQNVGGVVKARARKLDAEEKALRKARRYRTPKLPAVPAAPGPVPSYSYTVARQPVAAPPTPTKPVRTRHVTLTRVVHGHSHPKTTHHVTKPRSDESTSTTTTTEETTPTTTVATTTQAPVTTSTTSTVSSDDHGDDSHEDSHDDGGSVGGDS